jgi:hypothetical protein
MGDGIGFDVSPYEDFLAAGSVVDEVCGTVDADFLSTICLG